MTLPTTTLSPLTIAQRLQQLAQVYQQGRASVVFERALTKLMQYEADTCRAQLHTLTDDLAEFEQRYALESNDFWQRYQAGQTDDRMDYMEWASLFQMAQDLKQRLQVLETWA